MAQNVRVEFAGGIESLFGNQKFIDFPHLPESVITCKDLIDLLRREHLKQRVELFVQDQTVRPGILVLINDVDWELEDNLNYKLCNNDRILFISTLHGG